MLITYVSDCTVLTWIILLSSSKAFRQSLQYFCASIWMFLLIADVDEADDADAEPAEPPADWVWADDMEELSELWSLIQTSRCSSATLRSCSSLYWWSALSSSTLMDVTACSNRQQLSHRRVHLFCTAHLFTQPPKSYALQCFSIGKKPLKLLLHVWRYGSIRVSPYMFPLAHTILHPKWHLDWFSWFCTAHGRESLYF